MNVQTTQDQEFSTEESTTEDNKLSNLQYTDCFTYLQFAVVQMTKEMSTFPSDMYFMWIIQCLIAKSKGSFSSWLSPSLSVVAVFHTLLRISYCMRFSTYVEGLYLIIILNCMRKTNLNLW